MILIFYIIMRIVIYQILIQHVFSSNKMKSTNTKKYNTFKFRNFKIIASILYYAVLDYYNINSVKKTSTGKIELKKVSDFKYSINKNNNSNNIKDFKYNIAYNNFLKMQKNEITSYQKEQILLNKINQCLPIYKDKFDDKLEFVEENLYKDQELLIYYKFAKENKFNVYDLILQWANKLYEIVHINFTNNPLINDND